MFLAMLLMIVLPGTPVAAPPDPWTVANRLVFSVPLAQFVSEADSPSHDTRLDWTSDGCSAPVIGSSGRSFDFTAPCRRHDFAYRNLGRFAGGTKWTPSLRNRVDQRFLTDMRSHCGSRPQIDRGTCRTWANLFYTVVRGFSGP